MVPAEDRLGMGEHTANDIPEGALENTPFETDAEEVLTEYWRNRANIELNEDENLLDNELELLRTNLSRLEMTWVLPMDKAFLMRFLRACSHNTEATMKMLLRYREAKMEYTSFFRFCLPSLLSSTLESGIVTVLRCRDTLSRRVWLFSLNRWNPYEFSREQVFSAVNLVLEVLAREPKTQVSGIIALIDASGLCWSHWKQASIAYIKAMVGMVQGAFPIRFREIHIVNESVLFQTIFSLVSPFLTEKIRRRLHFHGTDQNSLHRFIPASILPVQYGGTQGEAEVCHVIEAVSELESFCAEMLDLTTN